MVLLTLTFPYYLVQSDTIVDLQKENHTSGSHAFTLVNTIHDSTKLQSFVDR
jgi:diphthamide biosynthesis methyltransferase